MFILDIELQPTSLGTGAKFDPTYEISFKLSLKEDKLDEIPADDPVDLLTVVKPEDPDGNRIFGALLPAVSMFTSAFSGDLKIWIVNRLHYM